MFYCLLVTWEAIAVKSIFHNLSLALGLGAIPSTHCKKQNKTYAAKYLSIEVQTKILQFNISYLFLKQNRESNHCARTGNIQKSAIHMDGVLHAMIHIFTNKTSVLQLLLQTYIFFSPLQKFLPHNYLSLNQVLISMELSYRTEQHHCKGKNSNRIYSVL